MPGGGHAGRDYTADALDKTPVVGFGENPRGVGGLEVEEWRETVGAVEDDAGESEMVVT